MLQFLGAGKLRCHRKTFFALVTSVGRGLEFGQAEVQYLHEWPTTFRHRSWDDHYVGRLNSAVRKLVKPGRRKHADYLLCYAQDSIGRHRTALFDPRRKRLALQQL